MNNFEIPILLVFFCRDDKFKQVFEQIRILKPSKLYLYQDGPRSGRNDEVGISKCRTIAESIDWECEVHKLYQEANVGCNPSGHLAQKWLFENEEMGIILEDDVVPDQSFFYFCRELLYKYKDDPKVSLICGMNQFEKTDIKESYFFSRYCSIWGWASWRRFAEEWDPTYKFLDDENKCKLIEERFPNKDEYNNFINVCKRHKASGKQYFESIVWSSSYLHDQVTIIPKTNLISNVGIGAEVTHGTDNINVMPKKVRRLFYMNRIPMEFPLIHPKSYEVDRDRENKFYLTRFEKRMLKYESLYLRLKYEGLSKTLKKIFEKLWKRKR